MDIKRYAELKKKGAMKLIRTGKGNSHFLISQQRFDPLTGEETEPAIEHISREGVEQTRADALTVVAACDAMLADMDSGK